MLSLTVKCHRDAIAVAVEARKSPPGIVPQKLPTLAAPSRFELPAGYTKTSSVNASVLWHSNSVFLGSGTVTHAE